MLTEPPKHPQLGLEQGPQALGPIRMPLPACLLFLRMIDARVYGALHGSGAAGGVRRESAPRVDGAVGGLLHRLHRAIFGRLDDACPLATAPGEQRGPIFVLMAPPRLARLAAPTRAVSQRVLSAACGLALVPSRVREVLRFHRARQLPIGGRGERRLAQPPTPARAGAEMAPSFPGHASRRTRQAPQEGGEHPVRPRGLALVEEGVGEGMAGALAAIAPGAFASRAVGIGPPRSDVLAPAPGTLQGTLLPPQRMEVGVTLLDLEEGVDIREHRHG